MRLYVLRILAVALLGASCASNAQADAIATTVSPGAAYFLVEGSSPVSQSGPLSTNQSVSGNTVRLEACINAFGFSVPSLYYISYTVTGLPAGSYTVEYHRALCDNSDGRIVILAPYELRASDTFVVTPEDVVPSPIPVLGSAATVALTALLAIAGLVAARRAYRQDRTRG